MTRNTPQVPCRHGGGYTHSLSWSGSGAFEVFGTCSRLKKCSSFSDQTKYYETCLLSVQLRQHHETLALQRQLAPKSTRCPACIRVWCKPIAMECFVKGRVQDRCCGLRLFSRTMLLDKTGLLDPSSTRLFGQGTRCEMCLSLCIVLQEKARSSQLLRGILRKGLTRPNTLWLFNVWAHL